jgi:hypothetical protein
MASRSFSGVHGGQVNLIGTAVQAEGDGLGRFGPIEVVDERDAYQGVRK